MNPELCILVLAVHCVLLGMLTASLTQLLTVMLFIWGYDLATPRAHKESMHIHEILATFRPMHLVEPAGEIFLGDVEPLQLEHCALVSTEVYST